MSERADVQIGDIYFSIDGDGDLCIERDDYGRMQSGFRCYLIGEQVQQLRDWLNGLSA